MNFFKKKSPTEKPADVAAQVAAASSGPKKPQPLSSRERQKAWLLMALGVLLAATTLVGFASSASHFSFKSKEVSKSEPVEAAAAVAGEAGAGANASESAGASQTPAGSAGDSGSAQPTSATAGVKETHETEYADSVTIFALTFGAALILCGAFYGRLRSMKLGGLELTLAGEEEKAEAAKKAEAGVEAKVGGDQVEPAKAAAAQVALADLDRIVALGIAPTKPMIELVGEEAAKKVAEGMAMSG